MKERKYQDVLTIGRILSIILALFLGILIILSYIKNKFSISLLIFGLVIDIIVTLGFYMNHRNKISISSEGQISIFGKNIGNYSKKDYYTYISGGILHVEFNIKNIKKVYLPDNNKLKEATWLEKYFVSNFKKVVCIELKNPLKYKSTSLSIKISSFKDIKRIYVSVANPNKLLKDLTNF